MKICPNCGKEKEIEEFHKSINRVQSWCKECMYSAQKRRWIGRKQKVVSLLGGACSICGYSKNMAAIEFHHLDPSEKEFSWSQVREMKWETIVKEIKKCIMLCSNCHRETHWPNEHDTVISKEGTCKENTILEPTGKCPYCGDNVYGTKYCSVKHSSLGHRKVKRPEKEELIKLMATIPMVHIGKKYGVSDVAVKKWAKTYGII